MNRIQIYTGDGKGKTTAALGLMLRFLGSGGKACLIQFDKGSKAGDDFYSERKLLRGMRDSGLNFEATGLPRFDPLKETFRFNNIEADFVEARRGMALAAEALTGDYGLLILDELLSLILTGLLQKEDISKFLDLYEELKRPCELVITGHQVWPELEARVDLVTEMRKVKHYFDQQVKARKGIEF